MNSSYSCRYCGARQKRKVCRKCSGKLELVRKLKRMVDVAVYKRNLEKIKQLKELEL